MPKTRFIHYPDRPKHLTAGFAKREYQKLLARAPAAEKASKANDWIKLYRDWNALDSYIGSEAARISHAYYRNLASKKLQTADGYIREKLVPAITQPSHTMMKLFLKSRHKNDLLKQFGHQLETIYTTALKPADPTNTKLRTRASRLSDEYNKIVASATVKVQGQEMTLTKAATYLESPDEIIRKEAFLAIRSWVLTNRKRLANIFNKLVKIRNKMAQNVGYKSYTPLAYEVMARTDYGQREVEQFRKNIQKYATPLLKKVNEELAKKLGKQKLRPWDTFDPDLTLPIGIAPVNKQLNNAARVFERLSPKFDAHFQYMIKKDLIDLENRQHKRAGAYCTYFPDEKLVAILCNSVGNSNDVQTLMHEMGHAIQGWESLHIEATELQWGTAELAEIFSLGMEFLSLQAIDEFFNKRDATKFKRSRWLRGLSLICYVCVVDEFQHWIYANPTSSASARDAKWEEIADKYFDNNVDYKGYKKYRKARWYIQSHIYTYPFYYIDYALAEIVAMQLGLLDQKNHKKTVGTYLELCSLGGTNSFLKTLDIGGIQSPFDSRLIKILMEHAEKILI